MITVRIIESKRTVLIGYLYNPLPVRDISKVGEAGSLELVLSVAIFDPPDDGLKKIA
jgi:hypothetical protein